MGLSSLQIRTLSSLNLAGLLCDSEQDPSSLASVRRGQVPSLLILLQLSAGTQRRVFYEPEAPFAAPHPTLQGVCGNEDNGTSAAPGNRGYLRTQDHCAIRSCLMQFRLGSGRAAPRGFEGRGSFLGKAVMGWLKAIL